MTPGLLAPPASGLVRGKPARAVSRAATVLALYTFLLISRLPEIIPPLLRLRPILLVALAAIALAFTVPPRYRDGVFRFIEMRGVLALCALAVLGIPFSVWPGHSFRFVVSALPKLVLFFALILHGVRTVEEVRRMAWAFVGAALTLSIAALLVTDKTRVRVTGTYDANDLAFLMVIALPLAVCLAVESQGLRRWLAGATALLTLLVIVHTRSRGGFLSAAVVIALLVVKLPGRRPMARLLPIVAAVVILGGVASQAYWDRISTIWGGGGELASEYDEGGLQEARMTVWMRGIRLIIENPLLGVGIDGYVTADGKLHETGIWRTAHNSFILVGAELGLGGLALFVFLVLRAWWNSRAVIRAVRHDPERRTHLWLACGLELSVIAYAVGGLALSQAYSNIFYLLLALSAVLRRVTVPPSVGAAPTVVAEGGPR